MRQSCPPPSVPVRNHQTQTGWKKEDLGLIDPFFTLTAAEKSVVEKIVSMGFLPRERVARAVKQLASEKEVSKLENVLYTEVVAAEKHTV